MTGASRTVAAFRRRNRASAHRRGDKAQAVRIHAPGRGQRARQQIRLGAQRRLESSHRRRIAEFNQEFAFGGGVRVRPCEPVTGGGGVKVAASLGVGMDEGKHHLGDGAGQSVGEDRKVGAVIGGVGAVGEHHWIVPPHHGVGPELRRHPADGGDHPVRPGHVAVEDTGIAGHGVLDDEGMAARPHLAEGSTERRDVPGPEHEAVHRLRPQAHPGWPAPEGVG